MGISKKKAIRLVVIGFIFLSVFIYKKVDAASIAINGAMWSSTIGWVDASNLVLNDVTRTITGSAWSSNIGWVSFNASDISGKCPSSAPVSYDSSGNLSGYARAIAGTDAQGWDGCINFGTTQGGAKYTAATGLFSGAAWGDVNVGWLSLGGFTGGLSVNIPPLGASCFAPSIQVGGSGTVTVLPFGGTGSYTYGPWTGACTSPSGSDSCTKTYNTVGTFTSSVTVTSGSQQQSFSCPIDVAQFVGGASDCKPQVTVSGVLQDANFAYVGQLVTWVALGNQPYSWAGDGVVGSQAGSTVSMRYPTIGNKTVLLNGFKCTIGAAGTQDYLPIINDPNFGEF